MEIAALVTVAILLFIYGYYLMDKLDKALSRGSKTPEKKDIAEAPSRILLTGNLSDEEVYSEIKRFRESHSDAGILLFDSAGKTPGGGNGEDM